ncbi:MAG TPA: hypothetical protein VHS78_01750 [Candidatus Elarobacter sp.]|jgi:hypothetical protein|nr:hypothetical protein [Candidatus Elarobacter sp.]
MTKRFGAALCAALALAASAACALPASARDGAVLARLAAVENEAEAIAEGEVTGAPARAAAARAAAAWRAARPEVARMHAGAALRSVDGAVAVLSADRDPAALRRDGNEVTGALAPLFGAAGDRVPADLHRLDYLGRSIALDVRQGAWPRASADVAALGAAWDALRPRITSRAGGAPAAAGYDAVVRQLVRVVRTRSTTRVVAAANRSGAEVDKLEAFF